MLLVDLKHTIRVAPSWIEIKVCKGLDGCWNANRVSFILRPIIESQIKATHEVSLS